MAIKPQDTYRLKFMHRMLHISIVRDSLKLIHTYHLLDKISLHRLKYKYIYTVYMYKYA